MPLNIDDAYIDYISRIDFTKGFEHFHVVWPLKDFKERDSQRFNTEITNEGRKLNLSWYLRVGKATDPERTFFGPKLATAVVSDRVPAIFRVSVRCDDSTEASVLDHSSIKVFKRQKGHGVSYQTAGLPNTDGKDYRFHCWIDIPKVIATETAPLDVNNTPTNSMRYQSIMELSSNLSDLFSSVIAANPCPTSDVTLVILKDQAAGTPDTDTMEPPTKIRRMEDIERQFYCSRAILSARSPVFRAMFDGADWNENTKREVEIKEIDGSTMEIVLKFIYTSELPDSTSSTETLMKIIYAADKYRIDNLKKWCISVAIAKYPNENELRIDLLEKADQHHLDQLKSVCLSMLSMDFAGFAKNRYQTDKLDVQVWEELAQTASERQFNTKQITLA